ncbi:hypothetical protein JJ691_95760 [Kutzneria sp. CA-103260]|nr:hypothetical protein JJ691_95760 [Kutzneria sp. CA-103260]
MFHVVIPVIGVARVLRWSLESAREFFAKRP